MSESRIVPVIASHFLGVIFSCVLYGFTLAQTWYYFRSFPNDSRHTKFSVMSLSILGTVHITLVSASIYQYTIVWAGDVTRLSYVSSAFEAAMGISSVIAFGVQLAYAHRIWKLSSYNHWLTVPIVVLALIALGLAVALMGETVVAPAWQDTQESKLTALMFYFSSIACDLFIAGSQVYLFCKSKSAIGRLGGLIIRLIILVVNIGLLTSIDVTVFLVLFVICPSNGAYLVPYILMSHFYLNSFLGVLNSRLLLRELIDNDKYACPNIVPCSVHAFGISPPSEAHSQCLTLPLSAFQPRTQSRSQSQLLTPSPPGDGAYPIMQVSRV